MEFSAVESGFLEGIAYDPLTQSLSVKLKTGQVYTYFDVPEEVHKSMITAESVGRFFAQALSGHYAHRRAVELETPKDDANVPELHKPE